MEFESRNHLARLIVVIYIRIDILAVLFHDMRNKERRRGSRNVMLFAECKKCQVRWDWKKGRVEVAVIYKMKTFGRAFSLPDVSVIDALID